MDNLNVYNVRALNLKKSHDTTKYVDVKVTQNNIICWVVHVPSDSHVANPSGSFQTNGQMNRNQQTKLINKRQPHIPNNVEV